MNEETLLKLLELEVKEEQFYISFFHKKVTFFWGIISATIAGITIGAFKATNWEQYLFLSITPALLFVIASFMKKSLFRSYQRFIEVIAKIAKIEIMLGLHMQKLDATSPYWKNESMLVQRHLKTRSTYDSSEQFVNTVSKQGIFKLYSNLISVLQIFCAILLFISYRLYAN